jgi:hypothetical protein
LRIATQGTVWQVASIVLALLCVATHGEAQRSFRISVNTTPVAGQNGYLDLQFNPGGLDALSATATFSDVLTDGILSPAAETMGGASGMLPGPPAPLIINSDGFNDLFQGITFGNSITFLVTFAGGVPLPGTTGPVSGSTFALSLYDAAGITPLLTTALDGSVLHIDLNPDGTLSDAVFADPTGVARATISEIATAVPEPSVITMTLTPLLALLVASSRLKWKRQWSVTGSTHFQQRQFLA